LDSSTTKDSTTALALSLRRPIKLIVFTNPFNFSKFLSLGQTTLPEAGYSEFSYCYSATSSPIKYVAIFFKGPIHYLHASLIFRTFIYLTQTVCLKAGNTVFIPTTATMANPAQLYLLSCSPLTRC